MSDENLIIILISYIGIGLAVLLIAISQDVLKNFKNKGK